ncbi:MAG TPA: HAD-IA family hydrolase [Actinotalea sp.]|nr:HAD-IA family hydrolase [Actinotalea sp.]
MTSGAWPAALDRPFDAVLFDMDGTLISSTEAVERSWNRLAAEFSFTMPGFEEIHGIPSRATVDRLLADRPVAERDRAARRIVQLEVEDVSGTVVLPGSRAALEVLLPRRCAIVTSSTRRLAQVRLAAAGLGDVPAVTADDVGRGKPDPAPYLAGAALLGVPPERCLAVEDAGAGLVSARAAGMATLGLATTHAAQDLVADHVVGDLSAVRFVLAADGVRLSAVGNHPHLHPGRQDGDGPT